MGREKQLVAVAIRRLENFSGPADAKWNFAAFPFRQPLAHVRIELGLPDFGGNRTDVSVRIVDLKTVAHESSLVAGSSSGYFPPGSIEKSRNFCGSRSAGSGLSWRRISK